MGGWDVTLVEAQPFLGAGVRTQYYGGHPYTFGPRHFLTPMEHIYEFLDKYVPMRRCGEHEFITYVEPDAQFYTYPIHRDDFDRMPEGHQIKQELSAINLAEIAKLSSAEIAKMDRSELMRLNGAKYAKNLEEFWIRSIGRTLYDKFIDGYSRKMWLIESNSEIDDFTWSPKGVSIKEGP